jgi:hypothetical protein
MARTATPAHQAMRHALELIGIELAPNQFGLLMVQVVP